MDQQDYTIDPALLDWNIEALDNLFHEYPESGYASGPVHFQEAAPSEHSQLTFESRDADFTNSLLHARPPNLAFDLAEDPRKWPPLAYGVVEGVEKLPILAEDVIHRADEWPLAAHDIFRGIGEQPPLPWPRCPSDPLTRYGRLLAHFAFGIDLGRKTTLPSNFAPTIREIYWSSYRYEERLCEMLHLLDCSHSYGLMLSLSIAYGPEWLRTTPDYLSTRHYRPLSSGDQNRFHELLDRFEMVIEMLSELRVHCILVLGFDVTETRYHCRKIADRETSDSYDIENGEDNSMYDITSAKLEKFQHDCTKQWVQVSHYENRRIRRDIRAWARLARYGSMRLPDGTMLVHKHKAQIPRRRHKKPELEPEQRPLSLITTCDVQTHEPLSPLWRHRSNSASFSSGNSSAGSGESGDSSASKKRKRMPAREGGYPCLFPGCEKKFDHEGERKHHSRYHQDEASKPCGCETCDKRFVFPKDLWRHEMRVHANAATSEDIVSPDEVHPSRLGLHRVGRGGRLMSQGRITKTMVGPTTGIDS